MADPRFFENSGPIPLARLAKIANASLQGNADFEREFLDVKPLEFAGPDHVSFINNRRYIEAFTNSKAGAILVSEELSPRAPDGAALLITNDPYRGYALIAQAYYPQTEMPAYIDDAANIDPSSMIGKDTTIHPGATVMTEVKIGTRCEIGANSVLERGVIIGDECRIAANVTLSHCVLGDRVILHPGVCIGQDGFGFSPGEKSHEKVPQLGLVRIHSDVEIGANTTIDRGAGPDTIIGAGTKIDNLVQIGHNVEIGEGCLIVAQVGISGSTKIGDFAMIGGQAGIIGHLIIGNGARIAAQAGVTRNISPGAHVAGSPATEAREHWRRLATLSRLTKEKGL